MGKGAILKPLPTITSLQNPRVKSAVKLRDRSGRDKQQQIIIDGRREITRALKAGVQIVEVFYPEEDQVDSLLVQAQAAGVDLLPVSAAVLQKLAYGERTGGIVAVAATPVRSLRDLPADLQLVAVIEGAEKPGNLGAILRTADAAGVGAVIFAAGGTDLYNPNAIRASLGAIFTVPVCSATSREALDWLRARRFHILAARVDGAIDYSLAAYTGTTAILLGSEAHGLSDLWQGDDVTAIKLPMLGRVDSLNLSATAAVLFYEALRQRHGR